VLEGQDAEFDLGEDDPLVRIAFSVRDSEAHQGSIELTFVHCFGAGESFGPAGKSCCRSCDSVSGMCQ
jgi:hypothetical protein